MKGSVRAQLRKAERTVAAARAKLAKSALRIAIWEWRRTLRINEWQWGQAHLARKDRGVKEEAVRCYPWIMQ